MNPELKAKWVEALRSGEYKQGAGRFEKNGKFCCLGVLCKVAGVGVSELRGNGYWCDNYKFVGETIEEIAERDLINMNDSGKPFTEIADYIEANL